MIKQEFEARHACCVVSRRPEYRLKNILHPVVFSVDCVFSNPRHVGGSRCDEFIFFDIPQNVTGIYLIERKDNHGGNVTKVKEQLQGGATFIQRFLSGDFALHECRLNFMPVWVSKSVNKSVRHRLLTEKISLRGMKKPIRHIQKRQKLPRLNNQNK